MSGVTITSKTTLGVSLSLTQPSVTITGTGAIAVYGTNAIGVFAPAGVSGNIANYGTISAPNGYGVKLATGGTITNGSTSGTSALIEAGKTGIALTHGGVVQNFGSIAGTTVSGISSSGALILTNGANDDTTAAITGYMGIYTSNSASSLTNFGTISGIASAGSVVRGGIDLNKGGTIVNGSATDSLAAIIGAYDGIFSATGSSSTITNSGTITALGAPGLQNGSGIFLEGSSVVNNESTGVISGKNAGIRSDATMILLNLGLVSGGTYGVEGSNGTITNGSTTQTSAKISGKAGIRGASLTVNNFGTVSGGSGNGIDTLGNSTITNGASSDAAALITSALKNAVYTSGASATVTNFGTISAAHGIAVELTRGGTITNETSGTISGTGDILIKGAAGTVVNLGQVTATAKGSAGNGVNLSNGGSVTNGSAADFTASITGAYGVRLAAGGTVTNYAGIAATTGSAVLLAHGGTVDNGTSADTSAKLSSVSNCAIFASGGAVKVTNTGTIVGVDGILIGGKASGTVVNSGIIQSSAGPAGIAIQFGAGAERLVADPGAVFIGAVNGGTGSNTLELAAGASAGSIGGIAASGAQFNGFGAILVDKSAAWTLTGPDSTGTLTDNGALTVTGSLDVSTALGATTTGSISIGDTASLEVASVLGSGPAISFLGSGEVIVDNATAFGTGVGTVKYAGPMLENFGMADSVDLKGISPAGLVLNYSTASGLLQITGGAAATLLFQNASLGAGNFQVASDNAGGTLLTHS